MSHLTVQQLSSSLDGAVTGPSLELIVRHLAGCAECRDRHSRLARHDDVLRRLLAPEASAEFLETLGTRGEDIAVAIARGVPPPEMTTTVPLLDDEDPHAPSEPRPAERPELGRSGAIAQEAGFGRIGVKPTVPAQVPKSDPEEAQRWLEALEKGVPEDLSSFTVLPREKTEPDGPKFDLPAWIKERAARTRPMPTKPREVQKLKLVFDPETESASVAEPEPAPAIEPEAAANVEGSKPAEPPSQEPKPTEPKPVEPKPVEPKPVEPASKESKPAEPSKQSKPAEPKARKARGSRFPWFAKPKPAPEPVSASANEAETGPVNETEPVLAREPEPERVPVKEPEPLIARAPEPEPVKESEPLVARAPEPERVKESEPLVARAPEPERVKEPEPVVARAPEPEPVKEPEPVRARAPEPKPLPATDPNPTYPNWAMPRLVRDPVPRFARMLGPEPAKAPEPMVARAPKLQPERDPQAKYSRMPELVRIVKTPEPIDPQEEEPMTPRPRGSAGEPYRGSAPYERTPSDPPSYPPAAGTPGGSFATGTDHDPWQAYDDSDEIHDPTSHDDAYGGGEPIYATRDSARAAALRRAREEARRRGLRVHWFLAGGSVGTLLLVVVALQLMPVTREGERVASRFRFPRIELARRDSTAVPTRVNGAPELHSATTPVPVESVVPPAPREVPQDSSAMVPEDTSADSSDRVPGR